MERVALLLGGCLLVAVLAIGGIAGGADGSRDLGPRVATPGSSQGAAEQPPPLQVRVEPEGQTLDSDGPASYVVTVFNPEDAGHRIAFLTVGVSPPEKGVGLTVENAPPWFVDDGKLLWATVVQLPPGEARAYGVAVPPEAPPGDYEINSTVGYVDGANYTRTWDTAGLTVRSCRSVSGWVGCNWQWLLSTATLVVAVLAFFGFERVRDAVNGVLWSRGGGGR